MESTRTRWMVLAGSNLAVTKGEHFTAESAVTEVVGRLGGGVSYNGLTARWALLFGQDRLAEVATAQRLTEEREAAYKRLVHEASVAYRKAARESVKAQEAGQDQLWQKEAA